MRQSPIAAGLFRSGAASTVSQVVRMTALLLTHAVARRYIGPEEWGWWDWVQPILLVLAAVRDLGIPSHAVRLRPMPLRNLLWVEAGWGGFLGLGLLIAAPWISGLAAADSGEATAALRVLVVYFLLEGLAAVVTVWFEARLEIERTLLPDLARTGTYCSILLLLAAAGGGWWSFVVAQCAAQALYWILLRVRAARSGFELTRGTDSTWSLVRASWVIGTVWLLAPAIQHLDPFLLGLLFPSEEVGLYAAAYFLAFLVYRVLHPPLQRALYPALVAYREQPERQFEAYRLATAVFLVFEVPAAFALALNAERVLSLYAGDRYMKAAPLVALLALAPLVDPWGKFGGELLLARHADRARMLSLLLTLVALAGCGWWWSSLWGPVGMAWANFIPAGAPVVLWGIHRTARDRFASWLLELGRLYGVPALAFLPVVLLTEPGSSVRLAASALAATASLAYFLRRYLPRLQEFLNTDSFR